MHTFFTELNKYECPVERLSKCFQDFPTLRNAVNEQLLFSSVIPKRGIMNETDPGSQLQLFPSEHAHHATPIADFVALVSKDDGIPKIKRKYTACKSACRLCTICGQPRNSSFTAKNGKMHTHYYPRRSPAETTNDTTTLPEKRKICPCTDSEIQLFNDEGI